MPGNRDTVHKSNRYSRNPNRFHFAGPLQVQLLNLIELNRIFHLWSIKTISFTSSRHSCSTYDCYSSITKAADYNSQNGSFRNSLIWILVTKRLI